MAPASDHGFTISTSSITSRLSLWIYEVNNATFSYCHLDFRRRNGTFLTSINSAEDFFVFVEWCLQSQLLDNRTLNSCSSGPINSNIQRFSLHRLKNKYYLLVADNSRSCRFQLTWSELHEVHSALRLSRYWINQYLLEQGSP